MGSGIEALYIFNQHNDPVLQHTYRSRPESASTLLPLYLEYPAPRPSLIYLPNTSPPTLLFSLVHSQLLFLSPTSVDTEPLLVLEFLHRVVDVLEEFLGAPLMPSKIENNYDVTAQLLGEMCDAGAVSTTEPNALHDLVEVPGWVGKLLGGVGLPGSSLTPAPSTGSLAFQNPTLHPQTSAPQLPWRRSNVRHTSNELYVDIIESLSIILAPSGRPLSAFANGCIAFTSKLSGVPDIVLTLATLSGKAGLERVMELPVFHPCVRLARWRDHPGELSFVPPDGRCVLAGYEVDLLPFISGKSTNMTSNLHMPLSIEMSTGLGPVGADFEVRLIISNKFPGAPTGPTLSGGPSRGGFGVRLGTSSPAFGSSSVQPALEDVVVSVPIPSGVRNIPDIRPSRGEASYSPSDGTVEWRVPCKGATSVATLRCTVQGLHEDHEEDELAGGGHGFNVRSTYDYDENATYQSSCTTDRAPPTTSTEQETLDVSRVQLNATLMPSSATVSFSVKGWLASGIKVDSVMLNPRTSRGLGEGVKPYKGVKYLTVSKQGMEVRG